MRKTKGGIIIAQQSRRGHLINQEITFPEVRLVDADGGMIGIVPIEEALARADAAELDLVLISPDNNNPVAKLMDYGKFTFDQDKKKREAKKHQKTIQVKEVQIKLTTEEHDFNVKVRNAIRFLENGDRVKVVIRFRGREMAFKHQGYDVMQKVSEAVSEVGVVDKAPQAEGRNMIMYLAPIAE
ncbi:MAG: translation initiation factor IF-3 [Clostridiaceae bacterium]|nr:translation initiation factor IF-3 [Clostridiaceae bacterium]